MPPKLKFAEGEKVLCFHGPLIYEAKALKSQLNKDKTVKYLIHYAGWSKNWDEWVPEARVLKYNEANLQRQRELAELHAANNTVKNKKGAVATAGNASAAAKPKKSDSTSSSGKDVDSRASTPSKELKDAAAVATAATPSSTPTPSSAATTPVPPGAAASLTPTAPTDTVAASPAATTTTPPTTAGSATPTTEPKTDVATTVAATTNTAITSSSSTLTLAARSIRNARLFAATSLEEAINRKKRARLDANAQATTTTTTTANTTTSAVAAITAANLAASAETEEEFNAKVEIKIKIYDDLKPWLVDEWDAINRQQKLIELPAKQTVQDIVAAYVAYKKGGKQPLHANKELSINGFTQSLLEYFNVMLGCQLLYKFERPQYAELREQHPNKPMSSLYGAFHLLRLFTKIGSQMAFTTLDEKAAQTVVLHLQDMLKYMVKNAATLFSINHFVDVTSEYHRKVQ